MTAPVTSATSETATAPTSTARVASIDALRGLVILLMIFVNDIAGAPHVPKWLKHVGADTDAMTLPDIVFPAFLFIAGVSIPLAFERALAQGRSRLGLFLKVLGRTFALLVMGVVMVNQEQHSPWWHGAWGPLAYLAMFFAFVVVPAQPGRARIVFRLLRLAGVIALLALAFAYRDADGKAMLLGPLFDRTDTVWLRHSWWGILGLIGWAWFVAATVYLLLGHRREWLFAATGGLMLLYVASASGLGAQLASRPWLAPFAGLIGAAQGLLGWINSHVSIGSALGSHAALTMAGCCLGTILSGRSEIRTHSERLRWGVIFAAGLFLAGLLLDAPYGINKIRATPAWCFYSASLTTLAWVGLFFTMDICRLRQWGVLVQPAGANPLLAYLLHPFVFLLVHLGGPEAVSAVFLYRSPKFPAIAAIIGSLVVAVVIVQVTGSIARMGFRLKV